MDKEMLDKIKRHQGQTTMHKIGDEEFPFKPLGWKFVGEFFALGKKDMEQGLDEETTERLKKLIFNFVLNSWNKPEEYTEDAWKEEIESFCAYNITKLMEILFKVHNFGAEETQTIKGKLEQIKSTKDRMDEIRARSDADTESKKD